MIQLALYDSTYRHALRCLLQEAEDSPVFCVENPDLRYPGVLVLDTVHLQAIPLPIFHPERIVLVAGNRNEDLEIAWKAGLQSVVLPEDPISTALLAVLSARLHVSTETVH